MRNAKIVCTLGPASDDAATLEALADAGMAVARINASHGTNEDHRDLLRAARRVDRRTDRPVATMLDTRGPEVRTAPVDEPVTLETGTTVRLAVGDEATPETVGLTTSLDGVSSGDAVLLDDGLIELVVESVERRDADEVTQNGAVDAADDAGGGAGRGGRHEGVVAVARVESGGELGASKGVNVPGVDLGLDVLTAEDRRDLELAAELGVDFVAASFVRDAADVLAVSEFLEDAGAAVPVIAKIERAGAVDALSEIVEAAYGVMVARGDLGVELPMEDVPMIQKRIIRRCQEAGVPVITATEMLDSMVHQRRPTRAEASDVANAVLDGTDAVMLSAETAVGDHPVRVVETMDRIVREVEESAEYRDLAESRVPDPGDSRTDAIARSARFLARDLDATAVVVASESGYTARKTAKYRPAVPVVATTPNDRVRRQLALSWGTEPQATELQDTASEVIQHAVQAALDAGIAESGDTVVVVSGMMTELEGTDTANTLKAHVAAEALAVGEAVVRGRATGTAVRLADGDLSDAPEDAIAVLEAGFADEFVGDLSRLAGVVDPREGMTGYPAMIARELGIPMISGATVEGVEDGQTVTLDGERGVLYGGAIRGVDRGRAAGPGDRRDGAGQPE
ncbi:MAG: pyruvate kinase [Halobacteriaceae archaeon]